MLLREMFLIAMTESGQFQIPEDEIELKIDQFKVFVDRILGVYNSYAPREKREYLDLQGSRQRDLSYLPLGAPVFIADLIPIRISGVYPFYLFDMNNQSSKYLNVKQEYPWAYRRPVLTIPTNGEYDAHCVYDHAIVDLGGGQYEVPTITYKDHIFFDLLTGKFMQVLARNRRAFTLEALPIRTDAAEMAQEGKEMEAQAITNLETKKNKFYLAYR